MVAKEEALEALAAAARASGLIDPGSSAVVLVSAGPDSTCVAAALARLLGPEAVHALHVNYALRPEADQAERACRELCGRLRIDLHVERPRDLHGNLQAAAREVRYSAGERLRARTGADVIASGHFAQPGALQAEAGDQPVQCRREHVLVRGAGIGAVRPGERDPIAAQNGGAAEVSQQPPP